jgi:DNA-binding LytR/AlgR family response regulator
VVQNWTGAKKKCELSIMTGKISDDQVKYNDVPFFLVFIPVVNVLNYYLTYTNISFNAHTVLTFFIDTFEGYAAWLGFRCVIIYLDKTMPYKANPLKRILVQISVTTIVGLLIIIALTEIVNLIAKRSSVPASFYQYDIFIFLIWFFVLNGIYIALYYYHAMTHTEKLRQEDKRVRTEGFSVKDGRQNLVVAFDAIMVFFADDDYTALITQEAKRYLLDRSLDNIEQTLPGERFFRLNRKYIVHRSIVKGFNKIENGKLNVILSPSTYVPENIQVSRTKAPEFKTWFGPES